MKLLMPNPVLSAKLARLRKPIKQVHYRGEDPNILAQKPIVAVVGTRRPTPYGKAITEKLVIQLVEAGAIIVSGLAFGVDIIAHKAALEAGGQTIAVLPSGLDNIYPASHRRIAEHITQNGSLVSEYEPHHQPRKAEFLERNRIVAALSDAVIIPEAAESSGSLNTARQARQMDIPVFAIPGPITSSLSTGTNWLIKNGQARLSTGADDILKILNLTIDQNARTLKGSTTLETSVLRTIADITGDVTQLQYELGVDVTELQTALTMLEIAGKIEQNELGKWHIA